MTQFAEPYDDPAPGLTALFARLVLRVARMSLPFVLAGAVYACACVGLWRYAEARSAPMASGAGQADLPLELVHLPPWLSEEDVAAIRELGHSVQGRSLMDRRLPERLAAAYRASPWVERVARIRREYAPGPSPGRLQVELVIRKPFAQVRLGGGKGYVAIDRSGVRLPGVARAKADPKLPVVIGVSAPLPAAGRAFAGRGLTDAIEVLKTVTEFLAARPDRDTLRLVGIELTSTDRMDPERRRRIVLMARTPAGRRPRVFWGVHFRPGELPPYPILSTAEKLQALGAHLVAMARANQPPAYIDISVSPSVYRTRP